LYRLQAAISIAQQQADAEAETAGEHELAASTSSLPSPFTSAMAVA
jgi:hypothetical protein